ncbi:xanthine dehydrogenase [Prosthecomicrobium hirschii]|uniref:xanthine dehydrogenase n=1 Tax=Prosthecodimorpha hirschii TaxID=665126 RepID=UPI002220DDF7|nr:xanthine dehydrogenase [Prosthecomicrobium hirschii]MCW1840304.1 xanthine dehydrogenase [Prosthecomicrobium hirschii]
MPLNRIGAGPRAAPLVLVLGTNEIASAVAIRLNRIGHAVVLAHDPHPPVIRRGMAFHDILFGEDVQVDGIGAEPVEQGRDLLAFADGPARIGITRLGFVDLCPFAAFDVLIDARMNKYALIPDLRHLAAVTVGLGPGFEIGRNCDVAVETRPGRNGELVTEGATERADGRSSPLGGLGRERFVYSAGEGRWRTSFEIGTRVYRGMVVGHLAGMPVAAPLDGILRGLVRDDTEVAGPVKLLEIDPRSRGQAAWRGTDERGRTIADATAAALKRHRLAIGARS